MASPLPLFKRAIVQSAATFGTATLKGKDAEYLRLLTAFNISSDTANARLEALRQVPVEELVRFALSLSGSLMVPFYGSTSLFQWYRPFLPHVSRYPRALLLGRLPRHWRLSKQRQCTLQPPPPSKSQSFRLPADTEFRLFRSQYHLGRTQHYPCDDPQYILHIFDASRG